jgi:hypothetical protein
MPNTLTIGPGVGLVGVPKLSATQILVADVSALHLVQTEDFTIEMSDQYTFANDAVALRVKARLNVAAPDAGQIDAPSEDHPARWSAASRSSP